jgi:hypothetical protein
MQWVLFDGVPLIADGVSTNALPGRMLRGQDYRRLVDLIELMLAS